MTKNVHFRNIQHANGMVENPHAWFKNVFLRQKVSIQNLAILRQTGKNFDFVNIENL